MPAVPGPRELAYLAAGTLAGGFGRFAVASFIHRAFGAGLPYGTFAANMLGCLAAGALEGWGASRGRLSPEARLALITGFCGAFTTFSALIMETSSLWRSGAPGRAVLNVALSLAGGLLLFRLGASAAR